MLTAATHWIHTHLIEGEAITITNRQCQPYPEVTGYYIPTLLSIGEVALATRFAKWLVSVQNRDGSFSLANPNISYVFDTGQVIRGWVSLLHRLPELAEPLQRACQWIVQSADARTSRLQCPAPGGDWSLGARGEVNEGIHLYVLKPLQDAATLLNAPDIRVAADRALDYYLKNLSVTDFHLPNALTHFYAYMQEALFELGCVDEVVQGMAGVAILQQDSGAVPGYHDVNWVCSTGLAQLAKVWYLLGEDVRADRAMQFLAQLQNGSGGFYGAYGVNATYFPVDEISWAVKYAIDAECLRVARHFDTTAHHYAPVMNPHDGRAHAILAEAAHASRILDAGCGNGRYAALIKQKLPQVDVHAVDVSNEMLRHVPPTISCKNASIQNLPYPDNYFDLVYCVEALEHVPHPAAAIKEMTRVLRPGGRLIIIDKNLAHQGALQIESWERWFDIQALTGLLCAAGLTPRTEFVGYDDHPADGLFVAWYGYKAIS